MAPSSASQNPHVALVYPGWTPPPLENLATSTLLGKPSEVIEQALMTYRLLMINHVKTELSKATDVTGVKLLATLDMAGHLYLGKFNALVGPVSTAQFIKAYQEAHSGDIPLPIIYALAEQHTARIGTYFNETSREALSQGFNTFVNQKMPPRIAAERALDAYGLTPRQMSGYTSLAPEGKVLTSQSRSIKAKALDYIGRSIRRRFKIFATQEAHNLDMQAKQTAWMWMQSQGIVDAAAEKVWITAKDERVCKLCGPLHGKRAAVNDQFKLPTGEQIWVPGVHVNCRCEVRLVEPMVVAKADLFGDDLEEFNEEHPRDARGRFSEVQEAPSAFLEQTAQRAQRIRDRRPVIEEEQGVTLEKPQGVELSRPGSLRPVSLTPTGPVELTRQQPVELERRSVEMTTAPVTVGEQRKALELSLQGKALELGGKPKVSIRRPPLPILPPEVSRPPIEEGNYYQLDEPVYAVATPRDHDYSSVTYVLNDKMESNVLNAVYEADQQRSAAMWQRYNELTNNGEWELVTFTHYDPVNGAHYRGEISKDDVSKIIEFQAAYDSGDALSDQHIHVDFTNADGDFMASYTMSAFDIARDLGINDGDFAFRVIQVEQVDLNVSQQHSGTKAANEVWNVVGNYQAYGETPARSMFDGQELMVPIMELTPLDPHSSPTYSSRMELPDLARDIDMSGGGDDDDDIDYDWNI